MGAPAENMTAEAIAHRWGRVTGFLTDARSGTDDTEYAAFSAILLLEHGSALTSDHVADAWIEHLTRRTEGFPGAGFSELGTVENLRAGLRPPASGEHLHSWSDGLAMRSAVHGVFAAGDPAEAARLAAIDGAVSHAGEGIYAGQAVAAAVAAAMAGADVDDVVAAAARTVPANSWTARSIHQAREHAGDAGRSGRPLDVPALLDTLVTRRYPWTDLAPEAVGIAVAAFIAAGGRFADAVPLAVSMGRDADTTAAISGAMAGALGGYEAIPADWTDIGPVTGRCLGDVVRGLHLSGLAERLAEARDAR
ncbi:ADP-ribosylglycohydrolase family protein [Phytoactinopolyspora halotolerans]|uniref:ADP-ribosylglycohydrolase family protein n=2 Tax=Phytoactinopolyspora halotolerans TaxID=1981512 RepID=A0A6L9S8V0_9ACTN|nr:ADP-ribosylglycohydrolase family protein [Phytoactinopolyspora halotolerans]